MYIIKDKHTKLIDNTLTIRLCIFTVNISHSQTQCRDRHSYPNGYTSLVIEIPTA